LIPRAAGTLVSSYMTASILSDRQVALLRKIGGHQSLQRAFYLTGGTALAAFHLHHRFSEDLDFFSENECDMMALTTFLQSIKRDIGFQKADLQQSFNRNLIFLHFTDEILKLEFTYFPFPRIEQGPTAHGVHVDSLLDISVNKLFTIYQQARARDYIDLYRACARQHWTIADLIPKTRAKFDWHIDPLQLGTQLLKVTDVQDLPRMIENLPREAWETFFLDEARQLKSEIIG
jgi:predicted nucleotidyltransferase component of viral defense system